MQFHVLSFEGPDPYARVGGLATRVEGLTETLATLGLETHLWFVGDPDEPGHESRGLLHLHRWTQWVSRFHQRGVYDGEWGKCSEFSRTLPPYLMKRYLRPYLSQGGHLAGRGFVDGRGVTRPDQNLDRDQVTTDFRRKAGLGQDADKNGQGRLAGQGGGTHSQPQAHRQADGGPDPHPGGHSWSCHGGRLPSGLLGSMINRRAGNAIGCASEIVFFSKPHNALIP